MSSSSRKRVAFAGGGSGGHVYPLIAIALELKAISPETEIFFVSTKGSIEERLVPRYNFPLHLVPSGKLKSQSPLSVLKTCLQLFLSFFVCLRLVIGKKPDLVFSAGGYAGAPFLVVAALCGVRCEILEQNRVPGLANRWMAKFCRKIYVNFAASTEFFPGKEALAVGHPYRKEIEAAAWPKDAWSRLPEKFSLFVFGGSQGAMGINRLITAASALLKDLPIEIVHQTGEQDHARVVDEYAKAGFTRVRVEKYIHDMASAYRDAQLVICRAGASSLAELAAAEKACLLIPLVSKDRHQEYNAQEMQKLGASLCYLQPELSGEKLAAILKGLYHGREKLRALAERMGTLKSADAAQRVAKEILASIHKDKAGIDAV